MHNIDSPHGPRDQAGVGARHARPCMRLPGHAPLSAAMALLAVLAWAAPAHAEAPSLPIRTVLRGHAPPETIYNYLALLTNGCRGINQMPEGPVYRPSAAVLAATPIVEVETLYDGDRWAQYTTTANIVPDPSTCQPLIWRSYSVKIHQGCTTTITGSSGGDHFGPGEDADPARPSAKLTTSRCPESAKPRPALVLDGLPRHDAGLGQSCVWIEDMARRLLSTMPPVGPDGPDGSDQCISARHPKVPGPRGPLSLVLRQRFKLKEGVFKDTFPAPEDSVLVEYSEGQPLRPERFTLAAAEVFVKQARRTPIGVSR